MAKKEDKLYLNDIWEAILKIEKYTKGLSYEEFLNNMMVIDAVVRNLEIIGEATKNLSKEIKSQYPEIPWKEMAGIRDKLIHEYFGIDLDIVWKTIKYRLPELKKYLKREIER